MPKKSTPGVRARRSAKKTIYRATDRTPTSAKVFVVLPDDDADPLAQSFYVMLDDEPFQFRAIPHASVPRAGAHSLVDGLFEQVTVSNELAKFFKQFAYANEEGMICPDPKYNNDASAMTLQPLYGRVVFVRK